MVPGDVGRDPGLGDLGGPDVWTLRMAMVSVPLEYRAVGVPPRGRRAKKTTVRESLRVTIPEISARETTGRISILESVGKGRKDHLLLDGRVLSPLLTVDLSPVTIRHFQTLMSYWPGGDGLALSHAGFFAAHDLSSTFLEPARSDRVAPGTLRDVLDDDREDRIRLAEAYADDLVSVDGVIYTKSLEPVLRNVGAFRGPVLEYFDVHAPLSVSRNRIRRIDKIPAFGAPEGSDWSGEVAGDVDDLRLRLPDMEIELASCMRQASQLATESGNAEHLFRYRTDGTLLPESVEEADVALRAALRRLVASMSTDPSPHVDPALAALAAHREAILEAPRLSLTDPADDLVEKTAFVEKVLDRWKGPERHWNAVRSIPAADLEAMSSVL